jgi:hypothetical protein
MIPLNLKNLVLLGCYAQTLTLTQAAISAPSWGIRNTDYLSVINKVVGMPGDAALQKRARKLGEIFIRHLAPTSVISHYKCDSRIVEVTSILT